MKSEMPEPEKEFEKLLEQDRAIYGTAKVRVIFNPDGTLTKIRLDPMTGLRPSEKDET